MAEPTVAQTTVNGAPSTEAQEKQIEESPGIKVCIRFRVHQLFGPLRLILALCRFLRVTSITLSTMRA